MNYKQTIEYLYSLTPTAKMSRISRTKKILISMNSPQLTFSSVTIGGTNGKGSTAAFLSSIIQEAGYKVGLFTSPHLFKYNERIQINRKPISDTALIHYTQKIKKSINKLLKTDTQLQPGFFEMTFLIAMQYFADQHVDIAIMEVGLGGRLDPTRLSNNIISVITKVELDHTFILGNTREKIAKEKAAIIKKNSTVVCGSQRSNIKCIIKKIADKKNSQFISVRQKNIQVPLKGNYQKLNASLAIKTAEQLNLLGLNIPQRCIYNGIKKTAWPGRLQIISKKPLIIVDSAHNEDGITHALNYIKSKYTKKRKIIITAMSGNKDYESMAKPIQKISDELILTQAKTKGLPVDELKNYFSKQHYITLNSKEALNIAKEKYNNNSIIIIIGSIFLVSEIMKLQNNVKIK